ncbi:MAG: methylmalonyl-CoA epimerase [Sulfolobales archaeon]|nr:methylmalonyl-CoA epimerase [Sulfolobales archaeon]MDW7968845.1 methylmalonyl-CoA epimerase [Sulfolobales archaeon]
MKLHHIGIAVKDLETAMKFYGDVLKLKLVGVEEVPEEGVKIAMYDVGGVRVELLAGSRPDSAITKFIEKRGEGIHHIAFHVDDVDTVCNELVGKGLQLTYPQPKLVSGGARKINFINPKSTGGVLIEVVTEVGSNE